MSIACEKIPPQHDSCKYISAALAVVLALRDRSTIDDAEMEALVEAQDNPDAKKSLILGLKCAGAITDEQAAFAVGYRWPLGEA